MTSALVVVGPHPVFSGFWQLGQPAAAPAGRCSSALTVTATPMPPRATPQRTGPWDMAPTPQPPGPGNGRHQHCPPAIQDLVHQGSRIAALPSVHGRGCIQPLRMCHRIAVLSVTVAAGGSRLWSTLVAPSTSAAMNIQRSQAAATSRPLSSRSGEPAHRLPPERGGVEPADGARDRSHPLNAHADARHQAAVKVTLSGAALATTAKRELRPGANTTVC